MVKFNRKNFLLTSTALGAGLLIPSSLSAMAVSGSQRKRVLRVAHITDVHVQPEAPAPNGMARCLHEIQSLADKPDLIFNTGDSIMDALGKTKDRVQKQWDVWNSTLKNENSLEVVNCLGNHDIWGWSTLAVKRTDPNYGKQWATEMFGLKHRFYAFEKSGWKFIVLDSMMHSPLSYTAKIDEEQMDWLKEQLKQTPAETPICILSHIPILAACVFFDGNNMKAGKWSVPGSWMHQDSRKLKTLFAQHKNVKACLSGHIHLVDKVEYNGVNYFCNGAVSGAWWGGNYHEFPPAFAVMNFFDDGSVERELYHYNWTGG